MIARSIMSWGKRDSGTIPNTETDFNPTPGDMMLRTIQIEKLALGLCMGIVCTPLWMPQAMCAAKVTTPSGLQSIDLTVGNGEVAKAGDQVSVHYNWLAAKSRRKQGGRNLIPAKTVANHFNLRLDKVRSSKVGMKGYKG
jgi:hypothetical protein